MLTPALRHAAIVRPEQSNASGPAAANTYGFPSWARANATACAPRPDAGGAGGKLGPECGGDDGRPVAGAGRVVCVPGRATGAFVPDAELVARMIFGVPT